MTVIPRSDGLAYARCSRPVARKAIVIGGCTRGDTMHLMPSQVEIRWHRTSATSAVGRVVPAGTGAVLSSLAVAGDWYLLPGSVSAPYGVMYHPPWA